MRIRHFFAIAMLLALSGSAGADSFRASPETRGNADAGVLTTDADAQNLTYESLNASGGEEYRRSLDATGSPLDSSGTLFYGDRNEATNVSLDGEMFTQAGDVRESPLSSAEFEPTAVTAEPASLLLLSTALGAMCLVVRKRVI